MKKDWIFIIFEIVLSIILLVAVVLAQTPQLIIISSLFVIGYLGINTYFIWKEYL